MICAENHLLEVAPETFYRIRISGYDNIEWNFDMKLSCDNIIKNSKYSPNSTLNIGVEIDRFGSIVNTNIWTEIMTK